MSDARVYGIEELAELGGVTRRTVRYYVQEGLLPAPRGVGRGRHYGPEHLARLLEVKAMQERGESLEAILRAFEGGPGRQELAPSPQVRREVVTRIVLAGGLELIVSGGRKLPPPGTLAELAAWCDERFRKDEEK